MDYKFPAHACFACRTASMTVAMIRDMIKESLLWYEMYLR
jgi:hypothetical protein